MSSAESGTNVARDISNEAVKLIAEFTGRGPTKARTILSGDWVFITLQDSLTKGERQLAANGHAESVLNTRRDYQRIMRPEFAAIVARHVGRKPVAFMSDNHIEPDVGVEVFMLEPNGADPHNGRA